MKPAVCSRCGKESKHMIPDDATDVMCFRCSEEEADKREGKR